MSTVQNAAFLAVITLALGSSYAAANFTFPFFGNEPCKTNVCGKGSCVASSSSTFGFECECEKGWKQARSDNDQFFKFMPCVIPNCTLNFSCAKAPAPAPNPNGSNFSVFDRNIPFFTNSYHPIDLLLICSCFVLVACYWTDCGGGSCNNTSVFTHSCVCEEGYYNLFNSTSFPCYKECAIGGDCGNLGISVMNASNLSPPRSSGVVDDSKSHATILIHRVEFSWLITLFATLAPAVWKYS